MEKVGEGAGDVDISIKIEEGNDGGDVDISIKIKEGNDDGGGDSHYHGVGDAGRHQVRGKKLVVIVKDTAGTEREQIIGCSTRIQ